VTIKCLVGDRELMDELKSRVAAKGKKSNEL